MDRMGISPATHAADPFDNIALHLVSMVIEGAGVATIVLGG